MTDPDTLEEIPGRATPFVEVNRWATSEGYDMETHGLQTFLPYDNFRRCAQCLDGRRLGKQRVEAYTIISTLAAPSRIDILYPRGWGNHPASLMWVGHLDYLLSYYNEMIYEWIARGFSTTLVPFNIPPTPSHVAQEGRHLYSYDVPPVWLGMPELHASHRAALMAKKPDHYTKFEWTEPQVIDYFWPVSSSPKPIAWAGCSYIGNKLENQTIP